jgi:hypothetical protein
MFAIRDKDMYNNFSKENQEELRKTTVGLKTENFQVVVASNFMQFF